MEFKGLTLERVAPADIQDGDILIGCVDGGSEIEHFAETRNGHWGWLVVDRVPMAGTGAGSANLRLTRVDGLDGYDAPITDTVFHHFARRDHWVVARQRFNEFGEVCP